MVLNITIKDVLCTSLAGVAQRFIRRVESYIVPVSPTHLEASITTRRCVQGVTVASDVLKGMTSSPLTWSRPAVPLQLVWLGEAIP